MIILAFKTSLASIARDIFRAVVDFLYRQGNPCPCAVSDCGRSNLTNCRAPTTGYMRVTQNSSNLDSTYFRTSLTLGPMDNVFGHTGGPQATPHEGTSSTNIGHWKGTS